MIVLCAEAASASPGVAAAPKGPGGGHGAARAYLVENFRARLSRRARFQTGISHGPWRSADRVETIGPEASDLHTIIPKRVDSDDRGYAAALTSQSVTLDDNNTIVTVVRTNRV